MSKRSFRRLAVVAGAALAVGSMAPAMAVRVDAGAGAAAEVDPTMVVNDVVNITGICVISEIEDLWFYQPRSFVLLIADLADVQLVQAPPWWTSERLSRALISTCLVLLAVVGWVWALRRQVDQKRAVIQQQARHAAAWSSPAMFRSTETRP